jgi:hypothetical protein
MSDIVLPTTKIPASIKSPRNLIILSKPKTGKTTLLAELDNCLILDLEKGTDGIDAMKIHASSIEEIKQIGEAIKKAGNPYTYIAVDTVTALEEMCIPYAEKLYAKTSMGKNWFKKKLDGTLAEDSGKATYGSILNLPNGGGYFYLREAFTKVVEFIKTWAPRTILVGHVKDTLLDKAGVEVSSLDLDLTGKLKRISTSQSDAIGYLYRKNGVNKITFKTTDEIACGARPPHLRNEEFVISELKDDKLVTYWDKIYID